MCLVTEKLKFCTCASDSPEKLKHYWILHRFNKDKNLHVLGMPIFNGDLFVLNYETNKSILEKRLNEKDAFDFHTDFKENDHLEICLNNHCSEKEERGSYCFKFKKGKWVFVEYDYFDLISRFDDEQFGKLKGVKKTS